MCMLQHLWRPKQYIHLHFAVRSSQIYTSGMGCKVNSIV